MFKLKGKQLPFEIFTLPDFAYLSTNFSFFSVSSTIKNINLCVVLSLMDAQPVQSRILPDSGILFLYICIGALKFEDVKYCGWLINL